MFSGVQPISKMAEVFDLKHGDSKMSKINLKGASEPSAVQNVESKRQISEKQPPTVQNKKVAADKLELSDRAATIGKLVDKLNQAPDIRADRVEALRAQIAKGEYHPDAKDIADAIAKDEK